MIEAITKFCIFIALFNVEVASGFLNILSPYYETIHNTYENLKYEISFNETKNMTGLFYQNINKNKYQFNIFLKRKLPSENP